MINHVARVMLCGCGWLGQPLASRLISQGIKVYGTTTRTCQLSFLNELGITPHLLSISKNSEDSPEFNPSLLADLAKCDVLVINIPPGRRDLDANSFTQNMLRLFKTAMTQQPDVRIIFVSTTSVFGDVTGQVDEDTPTAPVTASGIAHQTLEHWLLKHASKQSTIVRLAGLINQTRHPVTSLVKRSVIEQGHQVVNLVHQIDAVNGLLQVILKWNEVVGHILHLCAPEHPTREDYYQAAAQSKQLPKLKFISNDSESIHTDVSTNEPSGKIVMSQKTQQMLGFEYDFPSPYDML